jgi:class 3 adenylate cyclase/GAF domain-containing protein
MATLFLLDQVPPHKSIIFENTVDPAPFLQDTDELWVKSARRLPGGKKGLENFRTAFGKGIAGHVAQARSTLRLENAYSSEWSGLVEDWDKKTGYSTRSIIATPLIINGGVVGVLLAANKNGWKIVNMDGGTNPAGPVLIAAPAAAQAEANVAATTAVSATSAVAADEDVDLARRPSNKKVLAPIKATGGTVLSQKEAKGGAKGGNRVAEGGEDKDRVANAFSPNDEKAIQGIASQAAVMMHHHQLKQQEDSANSKSEALLRVASAFCTSIDTRTLMTMMMDETRAVINADRCALYLIDTRASQFWSIGYSTSGSDAVDGGSSGGTFHEQKMRFPLGEDESGLLGYVVDECMSVSILDCRSDPRFNAAVNQRRYPGYKISSVMCCPLLNSKGECFGCIELVNKLHPLSQSKRQRSKKKARKGKVAREEDLDVEEERWDGGGSSGGGSSGGGSSGGGSSGGDLRRSSVVHNSASAQHSEKVFPFDTGDVEICEAFCAMGGMTLDNAELFRSMEDVKQRLQSVLGNISELVVTFDSKGHLSSCNHFNSLRKLCGGEVPEVVMKEQPVSQWMEDKKMAEQIMSVINAKQESFNCTDHKWQGNTMHYYIQPLAPVGSEGNNMQANSMPASPNKGRSRVPPGIGGGGGDEVGGGKAAPGSCSPATLRRNLQQFSLPQPKDGKWGQSGTASLSPLPNPDYQVIKGTQIHRNSLTPQNSPGKPSSRVPGKLVEQKLPLTKKPSRVMIAESVSTKPKKKVSLSSSNGGGVSKTASLYLGPRSVSRASHKRPSTDMAGGGLAFEEEDKSRPVVMCLDDKTPQAQLKNMISKYMSPEVVDKLLYGGKLHQGGTWNNVSILFADIRSYTSYAEAHGADEVFSTLNEYFEEMVGAITSNGGIVDKYIGDAIMAVFGIPNHRADHAACACRAAMAMQQRVSALNQRRRRRGEVPLYIGIGVSSGDVLCGNIGSEDRFEYTVIGDTVNLASRLESATKEYGVNLLVSEETVRGAAAAGLCSFKKWGDGLEPVSDRSSVTSSDSGSEKGAPGGAAAAAAASAAGKVNEEGGGAVSKPELVVRIVDKVMVKGKKQATVFTEVVSYRHKLTPDALSALNYFNQGLYHYSQREWDAAIEHFEASLVSEEEQEEAAEDELDDDDDGKKVAHYDKARVTSRTQVTDGPGQLMLERCKHLQAHPPAASWNGAWEMKNIQAWVYDVAAPLGMEATHAGSVDAVVAPAERKRSVMIRASAQGNGNLPISVMQEVASPKRKNTWEASLVTCGEDAEEDDIDDGELADIETDIERAKGSSSELQRQRPGPLTTGRDWTSGRSSAEHISFTAEQNLTIVRSPAKGTRSLASPSSSGRKATSELPSSKRKSTRLSTSEDAPRISFIISRTESGTEMNTANLRASRERPSRDDGSVGSSARSVRGLSKLRGSLTPGTVSEQVVQIGGMISGWSAEELELLQTHIAAQQLLTSSTATATTVTKAVAATSRLIDAAKKPVPFAGGC